MHTVYDEAILEVGENGKFQRNYDIVYNGILVCLWMISYMNLLLVISIPTHTCALPPIPKSSNISKAEWKQIHIPQFIDGAGEKHLSSCTIYTNFSRSNEIKDCKKYEYDSTWFASTLPSDNDWVCDKEIYVAHIYSYSRLGELVGSLLFGWLGDAFGRRWAYILSLMFLLLGRAISLFSGNWFTVFVIGCVLAALPSWTLVSSITIISLETTSSDRITFSTTLRNVSGCLGLCIMPFFYWWLKEWKLFFMITSATQIPFLIFSWKLIESPRWLWLTGKTEECIKTLQKIAKTNGKRLSSYTEEKIRSASINTGGTQNLSPHKLISSWNLCRNTVCLQILWISLTLSYSVLIINSTSSSEGNPFLNFAWQAAAEIPGNFVGALLCDKLGRRYAGSLSFGAITLVWILCLIRSYSTIHWTRNWWVGTLLFMINRFITTLPYYVNTVLNMELYPTCLRQSGMSIASVFSSLTSALAPYLLLLDGPTDKQISFTILICASILAMICALILPETLNAKLPETLEEAQNFGKHKRQYSSVPVLPSSPTQDIQNNGENIGLVRLENIIDNV